MRTYDCAWVEMQKIFIWFYPVDLLVESTKELKLAASLLIIYLYVTRLISFISRLELQLILFIPWISLAVCIMNQFKNPKPSAAKKPLKHTKNQIKPQRNTNSKKLEWNSMLIYLKALKAYFERSIMETKHSSLYLKEICTVQLILPFLPCMQWNLCMWCVPSVAFIANFYYEVLFFIISQNFSCFSIKNMMILYVWWYSSCKNAINWEQVKSKRWVVICW